MSESLRIFLSYRREDASGHAGRLYDALSVRFGPENVFIDIDTIDLGADFADVITEAVSSCDVLIALVGRHWLDATDSEGRRRLDNPDDFVRLEVEAGLKRDVFVIPAWVQGAQQPTSEQLPEALASLARRQGTELRDIGWRDDVARLIERLERLEREKAGEDAAPALQPPLSPVRRAGLPERLRSRRALVAGGLGLAALVAAATTAVLASRGGDGERGAAGRSREDPVSRLRALIPAVTRPSCRRITYGAEAARTSLECAGARVAVTYHLFPSKEVMDAWYVQRRELAGIEPLSGSCAARSFRGDARYAGETETFAYFCHEPDGSPALVWTGPASVGAEANVYEGKGKPAAESLLRQWRCCLQVRP